MQIQLYTIPIINAENFLEEMNAFLRSKKILQVEKQLVTNQESVYWCFCISYMDDITKNFATSKEKIDYMKVLDKETFERFSVMREVRKTIASAYGVPAYNVFIDAELAVIAKMKNITLDALKSIKGIGEKKIEKFGQQFLDKLKEKITL